jgi:hypothetical protein
MRDVNCVLDQIYPEVPVHDIIPPRRALLDAVGRNNVVHSPIAMNQLLADSSNEDFALRRGCTLR